MTEAEWLASNDPAAMLEWVILDGDLSGRSYVGVSRRKLRLFAVACCREGWANLDDYSRRAVEAAERYADDPSTKQGLEDAHADSFQASETDDILLSELAWGCSFVGNGQVLSHLRAYLAAPLKFGREAALLREIVGNPFLPVTLPQLPHAAARLLPWELNALAAAAYEERQENGTLDPTRLLVLADALEEAGCAAREPDVEAEEYETCGGCGGHGKDVGSARHPEDQADCYSCGGTGGITVRRSRPGKPITHPLLAHLRWRPCVFCKGRPRDLTGGDAVPCRMPGCMGAGCPHVRGCWALDLILGLE